MIKRLLVLSIAVLFSVSSFAQVKVGKAVVDYKINRYGEDLQLNGAGIRSKSVLDLYAAGLYLKEKSNDALGICFADENMSLILHITSRVVDEKKLTNAINEGFDKATDHNPGPLKERTNYIKKLFSDPVVKGDVIEFLYEKGFGLHFIKNNKEIGTIEGQDFKFVFFKIWLGDEPATESLKKDLLGM